MLYSTTLLPVVLVVADELLKGSIKKHQGSRNRAFLPVDGTDWSNESFC